MKIKIAPSMLSANFAKFGEEVVDITKCGADLLHMDVMDGNFVPNFSFGQKFIKEARPYTDLIMDTHLMILNPWKYIEEFAKAGRAFVTENLGGASYIMVATDYGYHVMICTYVVEPTASDDAVMTGVETRSSSPNMRMISSSVSMPMARSSTVTGSLRARSMRAKTTPLESVSYSIHAPRLGIICAE